MTSLAPEFADTCIIGLYTLNTKRTLAIMPQARTMQSTMTTRNAASHTCSNTLAIDEGGHLMAQSMGSATFNSVIKSGTVSHLQPCCLRLLWGTCKTLNQVSHQYLQERTLQYQRKPEQASTFEPRCAEIKAACVSQRR